MDFFRLWIQRSISTIGGQPITTTEQTCVTELIMPYSKHTKLGGLLFWTDKYSALIFMVWKGKRISLTEATWLLKTISIFSCVPLIRLSLEWLSSSVRPILIWSQVLIVRRAVITHWLRSLRPRSAHATVQSECQLRITAKDCTILDVLITISLWLVGNIHLLVVILVV